MNKDSFCYNVNIKKNDCNDTDGFLFQIDKEINCIEPYTVKLCEENKILNVLIDTGSSISAISLKEFKASKEMNNLIVKKCEESFKSYVGDPIIPLGTVNVKIKY